MGVQKVNKKVKIFLHTLVGKSGLSKMGLQEKIVIED